MAQPSLTYEISTYSYNGFKIEKYESKNIPPARGKFQQHFILLHECIYLPEISFIPYVYHCDLFKTNLGTISHVIGVTGNILNGSDTFPGHLVLSAFPIFFKTTNS